MTRFQKVVQRLGAVSSNDLMDSTLCDPFGDLAQGHLIALNVHSDNEGSVYQHHKVDTKKDKENNCNFLKEGSDYYILLSQHHTAQLSYEKIYLKDLLRLALYRLQNKV